MRKPLLSLHILPLHLLQRPQILFSQPTTLLVATASFTVQRVKDTSVHLSQTEGEVYSTTARVAASDITTALNAKNEKIQQQLQFLKLFPVPACSLLTDEETADGHSKTGSQTKLLL